MGRVVLVSGHYVGSKRKAGFHWLAESFRSGGWEVFFMTAPISWLSWMRGDHRFQYPVRPESNRIREVAKGLTSFVWMTPWHPANYRVRILNRLFGGLVARYADLPLGEAESRFAEADVIIFESTPALVLFDRIRALAPNARLIYRVSDDLRLLGSHPRVLETEDRIAESFDLVSVPCDCLLERFRHLPGARLHPHGIRKDLFDAPSRNPYEGPWERHLIFVGNDLLDFDFVERARRLRPDWAFHMIGPLGLGRSQGNLFAYGEMPFAETVPYLRHADIGLQTRAYAPGAESLTDSLKVIQYTWSRLPIIAPEFLRSDRSHVLTYTPGEDRSIADALTAAEAFDRSTIDRASVLSWDEVRDALLRDATPPRASLMTGGEPVHVPA